MLPSEKSGGNSLRTVRDAAPIVSLCGRAGSVRKAQLFDSRVYRSGFKAEDLCRTVLAPNTPTCPLWTAARSEAYGRKEELRHLLTRLSSLL